MATLNARRQIRGADDEDGISFSLQSSGAQKLDPSTIGNTSRVRFPGAWCGIWTDIWLDYLSHQGAANRISIKIDTTREYARDGVSGEGEDYACRFTDVYTGSTPCQAAT